MFTGIVQAVGRIDSVERFDGGLRLALHPGGLELADLKEGDSIAVQGVCLTVTGRSGALLRFDVSAATLAVSTGLGGPGDVNLERALRLGDQLGGHLASGHVDGVGEVVRAEDVGENLLLEIEVPAALARYVAAKGSIGVDGVSLTVNEVHGASFVANIIPHTLRATTLGRLGPGSRVNLEVDLLARYVERMLHGP